MKTRTFSPGKVSRVQETYRRAGKQESRFYCDLCMAEVGEAEGKTLPDGRFVHKRHKIQVPEKKEAPVSFWISLKERVSEILYEGMQ